MSMATVAVVTRMTKVSGDVRGDSSGGDKGRTRQTKAEASRVGPVKIGLARFLGLSMKYCVGNVDEEGLFLRL